MCVVLCGVGLSYGPVSSTNKWIWVISALLKPIYIYKAVCGCKYSGPKNTWVTLKTV